MLGAGAGETVVCPYADKEDTIQVLAKIASAVFADGTSYRPDNTRRKAAYVAAVETLYPEAKRILELPDTHEHEAVREYLPGRLSVPSGVLPMSVSNMLRASPRRHGVNKGIPGSGTDPRRCVGSARRGGPETRRKGQPVRRDSSAAPAAERGLIPRSYRSGAGRRIYKSLLVARPGRFAL